MVSNNWGYTRSHFHLYLHRPRFLLLPGRQSKQTLPLLLWAQGGEYSSDSRVASDTPAGPMFALIVPGAFSSQKNFHLQICVSLLDTYMTHAWSIKCN